MERFDIRITKEYVNANNDVEVYVSDKKHIIDIINAGPNEYKESPNVGVGIHKYLNSQGADSEIKRNVMLKLQADGYRCDSPMVYFDTAGKLTINPNVE